MQIATFTLLCILFLFTISKLKHSLFYLLPFIYLSVTIYTFIGTEFLSYAKNVPFNFFEDLSGTVYQDIYLYYLLASFSFILGLLTFKNADILILFRIKKQVNFNSKVKGKYVIFLYVATILFLHLGYGIENLYYREGYTLGDNGITAFRILYTMILPLTCLLIPLIKSNSKRYILILILFILIQGTSSRNLVLIPVCYYIGAFLRDQKVSLPKSILALIMIVLSVNIAIQYRDNQSQGVIPNIIYFYTYGLNFDVTEYAINYLTSFSIYASAITLHEHEFNIQSFLVSINPLPSQYLNIENMVDTQKLNSYAPFPAIGMLTLGGPSLVFIYYYLSALIWSYFGLFLASRSKILAIATLMLFILFCFLSLQYNLRSVTRLLYYLILISFILKFIRILNYNFTQRLIKAGTLKK
ncbi:hypothetical protein [Pseudocolwellia sp. HL-MZ7]|uniref:hypothetical protein n=1 Tax=Pseudocolwellia sp. HL-MZ7 TaxID=3400627 RepID=UPI003CFA1374